VKLDTVENPSAYVHERIATIARLLTISSERCNPQGHTGRRNVMNLVRWEPFSNVDELFNRMLPASFGRWPRVALPSNGEKAEWAPSADVSETEKEYLIRAELPAVKKEDVRVTIDHNTITIEGERKQEKEDKTERYHRVESFHGSFLRSFSLPENASIDDIRCESKDGVLTVHIPKIKVEAPKAKQIKVE
jgi:HSP20 family protein